MQMVDQNESLSWGGNDSFGDERQLMFEQLSSTAAPEVLPQEEINVANLIWTIGFTVIVVVGTCGNGIVLWIILGKCSNVI